MFLVAILAADFAALSQAFPRIPNPGLVLMVLILEVGLFHAISRRGPARFFWIGFESVGWVYVLTCFAFDVPLWRFTHDHFKTYFQTSPIFSSADRWLFILYASVVQFVLALTGAIIGGFLGRAWKIRFDEHATHDPLVQSRNRWP